MIDDDREARLIARLGAIRERVEWMTDFEARSEWVGVRAAHGDLIVQKERLVEDVEHALNQIERIGPTTERRRMRASPPVQLRRRPARTLP